MLWAAVALIIIGVGLAIMLLTIFGDGKHTDQLAAVQTAGTIVVGTGGAAALWLTARRQQATEIALNQAKDSHALQEQVADAAKADAEARRVTDLYTKAADQIGSDKAPVRLAGLYAFERVAQENPEQRQTIVNVISAYLRMPYTLPPAQPPTEDAPEAEHARFEARTQEREVRLTAQRILAAHLKPGDDPDHPADTFWPDIDLDLTGATLLDFHFSGCCLNQARFDGATFTGHAWFSSGRIGNVWFDGAAFHGDAWFSDAQLGYAGFNLAQFDDQANFDRAFFLGAAFDEAQFNGTAKFTKAEFHDALFRGTRFTDTASFSEAQFANYAVFTGARLGADASFDQAYFACEAEFGQVRFDGAAAFTAARFDAGADFTKARVARDVTFNGAWAKLDRDYQGLPSGWTIVATAERPASDAPGRWGHMIREPGTVTGESQP
jgi:uncharacterized protein YjbI with pentapeptide repeats